MTWRTSRFITQLRAIGRATGANRLITSIRQESTYEERFDRAFLALVRAGDCAWDVGANQGIYCEKLSSRVGPAGVVFGFEPSARNFAVLQRRCAPLRNFRGVRLALGDSNGHTLLIQGDDALGATSRITPPSPSRNTQSSSGDRLGTEEVEVMAGEDIVRTELATMPNVMKIDVEGSEVECVKGLGALLGDHTLRLIGIEVHFGILTERGLANAPRSIERTLIERGFSVAWTDRSHIIANRPGL